MEIFTKEEKIQFVKWYYGGNSLRSVKTLFVEAFPDRPSPSVDTIHRVIQNFEKHGCISPRSHKGARNNEPNEEREMLEIMVCASANENPGQSLVEIADQVNVSTRTVNKILKKNGYKSYKVQKTHEIFPGDNFARMEFCESVMEMANRQENFLRNIVFTDESSFPLHGRHNPSIVRYWSRENLHRFFEYRTQYPQKLNVWGGIFGEYMIGPFFIEGNLTGPKYLKLLQQQIVPEIQRLAGQRFNEIWFQQDGCPAHNNLLVREYLNQTFPNRLLTGRGTILWPARCPDLAPCDFFLWGFVKSQIYGFRENRANNLEELRQLIEHSFQLITPNMLANVRRGFYDRLGYCLAAEGGLIEHLL